MGHRPRFMDCAQGDWTSSMDVSHEMALLLLMNGRGKEVDNR